MRTFVSYSHSDERRVLEILRHVAPYGVRPWIDVEDLSSAAGLPLASLLSRAIESCRSLLLFLSRSATSSDWLQTEVGEALKMGRDGLRVVPIALEPLESLTLPPFIETWLEKRDNGYGRICLDPNVSGFEEQLAAAVLEAGGAHEAKEIVLHLGHRDPRWTPDVPAAWDGSPVIDLRLALHGSDHFSPTTDEWREIVVLGLPLALTALLAHHLRQLGRINDYDQVSSGGADTYRLVTSWG